MKTVKQIAQAVAYFATLKTSKRDKFVKAVALALTQDLPISILVARPFRGYKSSNGKRYKIKIVNTRTGEGKLLGKIALCEFTRTDYSRVVGGHHYGGFSLESLNSLDPEHTDKPYSIVGPHQEERVEATNWGAIARAISDLFKKDFAHTEPCGKCAGMGVLSHYAHIDAGRCWDCLGCGFRLVVGSECC